MIPNILTSITAKPKAGKTDLSLTWPAPIKVYSFDLGADFVRAKRYPNKDITIHNFNLPIIETDNPAPWAEKIWDEFSAEYKADVKGGKYQTVIVDTATALWAVLRQAITEAKNRKRLTEVEYALPNLKMSAVFSHPRVSGTNLVVVQYLRDKYVNGDATGEQELDGWKQTEGQVDVVLEMERITKGGKTTMVTEIKDNRFNRDVNGQKFTDTNYDELVAILFG